MAAIDAYRQRYHLTYQEYLEEPEWCVQEVEVMMAVEAEVQLKQSSGAAPEAENHQDLLTLAQAQGFDLDPSWLAAQRHE